MPSKYRKKIKAYRENTTGMKVHRLKALRLCHCVQACLMLGGGVWSYKWEGVGGVRGVEISLCVCVCVCVCVIYSCCS